MYRDDLPGVRQEDPSSVGLFVSSKGTYCQSSNAKGKSRATRLIVVSPVLPTPSSLNVPPSKNEEMKKWIFMLCLVHQSFPWEMVSMGTTRITMTKKGMAGAKKTSQPWQDSVCGGRRMRVCDIGGWGWQGSFVWWFGGYVRHAPVVMIDVKLSVVRLYELSYRLVWATTTSWAREEFNIADASILRTR